ncbi:MAG TPA: hypothetical protein VK386_01280 [Acidimicrobiales bacterium]|nr:hypothetical protein [Acidimicrobiales bacterium]
MLGARSEPARPGAAAEPEATAAALTASSTAETGAPLTAPFPLGAGAALFLVASDLTSGFFAAAALLAGVAFLGGASFFVGAFVTAGAFLAGAAFLAEAGPFFDDTATFLADAPFLAGAAFLAEAGPFFDDTTTFLADAPFLAAVGPFLTGAVFFPAGVFLAAARLDGAFLIGVIGAVRRLRPVWNGRWCGSWASFPIPRSRGQGREGGRR